jgi:hypothetical protein
MLQPNIDIDPHKLKDKLFKVKKLNYNTYEIDHSEIKGTLRIIAIPVNILEVPSESLPLSAKTSGLPVFMLATQVVTGFSNRGKRYEPKFSPMTQADYNKAKRTDLTNYVIQEQSYEPWNEFVIQGTPPILVRTRTILTKVEWLEGFTNPIGDPALSTNHSTTHSVSVASAGEAGLT